MAQIPSSVPTRAGFSRATEPPLAETCLNGSRTYGTAGRLSESAQCFSTSCSDDRPYANRSREQRPAVARHLYRRCCLPARLGGLPIVSARLPGERRTRDVLLPGIWSRGDACL